MLLDRQRPLDPPSVTKTVSAPMRSAEELRTLLDEIGCLWFDGLSQAEIAKVLGISKGCVSGLVSRARARGNDVRFKSRPRPPRQTRQQRLEYDRRRYLRNHPAAKSRAVAAPVVEHSADWREAQPVTLLELRPATCRYPLNDPPRGRMHEEMLYCGRRVERGSWCAQCRELIYQPSARVGVRFVLPAIIKRPR